MTLEELAQLQDNIYIPEITVDLADKLYARVLSKQSDGNRYILITITEHGNFKDMRDYQMYIRILKPDGNIIYDDEELEFIDDGRILLHLSEQMLAVHGCATSELEFIKDGVSYKTMNFHIDIEPMPFQDDVVMSSSEFKTLDNYLKNTKETLEEATEVIEKAETVSSFMQVVEGSANLNNYTFASMFPNEYHKVIYFKNHTEGSIINIPNYVYQYNDFTLTLEKTMNNDTSINTIIITKQVIDCEYGKYSRYHTYVTDGSYEGWSAWKLLPDDFDSLVVPSLFKSGSLLANSNIDIELSEESIYKIVLKYDNAIPGIYIWDIVTGIPYGLGTKVNSSFHSVSNLNISPFGITGKVGINLTNDNPCRLNYKIYKMPYGV